MPRYKVGEVIVVGEIEAVVVRGKCESCFFYNHKADGCRMNEEVCIEEIGLNKCYKVLKEGL